MYARWLADATVLEQLLRLWEQYRGELLPRLAKVIGKLMEQIRIVPEGTAEAAHAAIAGLVEAQQDRKSGSVRIEAATYSQARELTQLVARISGRDIVLILDAWDGSSLDETRLLGTFLKREDEWPRTHIFLGIRNPDRDAPSEAEEALRRVKNLCRLSPAGRVYHLGPMDLDSDAEAERMIAYLREEVPATQQVSRESLLDLIAGFPGVVDFWVKGGRCDALLSPEELRTAADYAQEGRYPEFDHLFPNLDERHRSLAARLALFPRLDAEKWEFFRELLLADSSEAAVDALMDGRVLINAKFPTYGHDTRHAAARSWFLEHKQAYFRRLCNDLILAIVSRIKGFERPDYPLYEALASLDDVARQAQCEQSLRGLIHAAQSLYGHPELLLQEPYMMALGDVKRLGRCVPLLAVTRMNRAILFMNAGAEMLAFSDSDAVACMPGAPVGEVARALLLRGTMLGRRGDFDGEIAAYDALLKLRDAPSAQVSRALLGRGRARSRRGGGEDDYNTVVADYDAVIGMPDAPVEEKARALFNRGINRGRCGDDNGEVADYDRALQMRGISAETGAKIRLNRGIVKGRLGDRDGEIADYSAIIDAPDLPALHYTKALLKRAEAYMLLGKIELARADNQRLSTMTDLATDVDEE